MRGSRTTALWGFHAVRACHVVQLFRERSAAVSLSSLLQALVDAPTETRRIMPFKRMTLTDLTVEIPRLASKKVLTAAFNSAGAARACLLLVGIRDCAIHYM
jgi:hypothetical protein